MFRYKQMVGEMWRHTCISKIKNVDKKMPKYST